MGRCGCFIKAFADLNQRSRDIVARGCMDDQSKATLQERAHEIGTSAETIHQIEANALQKMKELQTA